MTETRFTKGPWQVHDIAPEDTQWKSRFEVWAGEPDDYATDEDGIPCAGLITSYVKGEANARLIAAAPLLYEAVAAYEEWVRKEREGPQYPDGMKRDSPGGEAVWRDWYDEQIALCDRADKFAVAALSAARGETGEE